MPFEILDVYLHIRHKRTTTITNAPNTGFEGGVHLKKKCANITTSTPSWLPADPCVDPDTSIRATLRPFPDMPLYVANEAFGPMPGWAEGSLVMAETVLHRFFGMGKPDWISNETYMKHVLIPPPSSGDSR